MTKETDYGKLLQAMYNQGFADCEVSAKLAIEAGIKKAILAEREACAVVCENFSKDISKLLYPFNGETSETKFVNSISNIVAKTFSESIRSRSKHD